MDRGEVDLYYTLLERVADAVFIYPLIGVRAGQFTFVNDAACAMLGYSREELLGMTPYDIMADFQMSTANEYANTIIDKKSMLFEWFQLRRDHSEILVELRATLVTIDPEQQMVITIARETAPRYRNRDNASLMGTYEYLYETSSNAIFILDQDGCFAEMNPAAEILVGCPREDIVGHSFTEHIVVNEAVTDAEHTFCIRNVLSGVPVDTHIQWKSSQGEIRMLHVRASCYLDRNNVPGIRCVARDITVEEDLRRSLDRTKDMLQSILDHAPIAIYTQNDKWEILAWNQGAERIFGWSEDEVVGLVNPTIIGKYENYDRVPDAEVFGPWEMKRTHKQGHCVDVVVWRTDIKLADQSIAVMELILDVTEYSQIRQHLVDADNRLQSILQSARVFLWSFDCGQQQITYCSANVIDIMGVSASDIAGQSIPGIIHRYVYFEDRQQVTGAFKRAESGEPIDVEYRIVSSSHRQRWVHMIAKPVTDASGRVVRIDGITIDSHDRKMSQMDLEVHRQRYKILLDFIPDAVIVHRGGIVQYANKLATSIAGVSDPDKLMGQPIWRFIAPDNQGRILERYKSLMDSGVVGTASDPLEHEIIQCDGTTVDIQSQSVLVDDQGLPSILSIIKDISTQKKMARDLETLAYYDNMTQLPNRILLVKYLDELLQSSPADSMHALLLLDLDRFKYINDLYGYLVGDEVNRVITDRLCNLCDDFIARIGGDEFVVIGEQVHIRDVDAWADRIINCVSEPIHLDKINTRVTASAGIVLFPIDGKDTNTLLKRADTAMYQSKRKGGNQVTRFQASYEHAIARQVQIEHAIVDGISRQEFSLVYQPEVQLGDQQCNVVEALVRWTQKDGTMIPPDQFIPIAEDCGQIHRLGQWILETACRQAAQWFRAGHRDFAVAVNISPKQFQMDMYQTIVDTLTASGLSPKYLIIEITEGVMFGNVLSVSEMLERIRRLGVRIAVDDFGTGYSSLRYLTLLEPAFLKIDRSFITAMLQDGANMAIVSATVQLAHELGAAVTAEGVETKEQCQRLQLMGCDFAQGYYFSKPTTAHAVETQWLLRKPAGKLFM